MAASQSFARLLRQYRHDAGLTLEQLSGNSGVSDRAISNMELGHSLGPQRKTVELIADALSLKGDNREALLFAAEAGRRRSYAPAPSVLAMPRGVTDFVGRAWEAGFLARLADAHHTGPAPVVVVSGTPGVGKTSFAVHAATELAANFPDGALFLDLSGLDDHPPEPNTIIGQLISAVAPGQRDFPHHAAERAGLYRALLRDRRMLIVLDNFEHVLPAAAGLGRFLAACPELTVLVTSRSPLRLRGEQEVPVEPLGTPPAGTTDPEAVRQSPAVQLFVARAVAVRPGFTLTPANAAAVAELCRRLDGIPLALELAAVQLRILTPDALLARLSAGLDRALDLAAGAVDLPDRQRTLRATLEWSYSLLSAAQQGLLARLSVFAGAWTLAAAEAAGTLDGDPDDTVDTLTALVAQSLIRIDDSDPDEPRFRMLETVRAYAAERLAERGETDATVARLARYLITVVQAVRDDLQGPAHRSAAERLDRERDEIRSEIDWAIKVDDAETVGWLLTPLLTYWWSRGLLPMTHDLAEKAAALPSAARLTPYASALLLGAQGMAMVVIGQTAQAEPLLAQTLQTAVTLGNARLRAYALLGLGWALMARSTAEASERLEDAAEAFRATGDSWGLAITLSILGQHALMAGRHAAAETMHREALAAAETVDNDYLRAEVLDMLGLDAAAAGDTAGARDRYSASAALHIRLLDYEGSAYCLSGLAGLALSQKKPAAAARLVAAADDARQIVGVAIWPGMQSTDRAQRAAVTAALSPGLFTAATAEGSRLRIPDALAYGLAATTAQQVPDPFAAWTARLRPVT